MKITVKKYWVDGPFIDPNTGEKTYEEPGLMTPDGVETIDAPMETLTHTQGIATIDGEQVMTCLLSNWSGQRTWWQARKVRDIRTKEWHWITP